MKAKTLATVMAVTLASVLISTFAFSRGSANHAMTVACEKQCGESSPQTNACISKCKKEIEKQNKTTK
jgi:hypothetical protein